MFNDVDTLSCYITRMQKHAYGLQEFTIEAEEGEVVFFDCNLDLGLGHQVWDAVSGAAKCLSTNNPVVITYGQSIACLSSITDEAEADDNIVMVWPQALTDLKELDINILEHGKPATEDQIAQLPTVIFVDENGKKIAAETVQTIAITDPRDEIRSAEADSAREDCIDDIVGAYFDNCLGEDCEDATIFITKFRLPNGKEIRSSISRSRASEKIKPVMAYLELLAA